MISGYTGGHKENLTYKEVCSGTTGHTEAVQITFDPEVFPYEKLEKSTGNKRTQRMQWDNSWTVEIHIAQSSSIIPRNKERLRKLQSSLASERTIQKRYRDKIELK